MRIYDPRLVRFLSVDPLAKHFAYYTPYQFAGNSPIANIDLDGGEPKFVAAPDGKQGQTKLTFPVVSMIAELYSQSYYMAGLKANIVINQEIHDRLTKYKSGAITVGFEINYTKDFQSTSARNFLELTGHEIVHVHQFIGRYGTDFATQNDYEHAQIGWIASYSADAIHSYLNSKDKRKDNVHDEIPIESEAINKANVLSDFLQANDFVRKRRGKNGVNEIKDNRVISLLKALDTSKDKNQKQRYQANFDSLMGLIKKYKEQKQK